MATSSWSGLSAGFTPPEPRKARAGLSIRNTPTNKNKGHHMAEIRVEVDDEELAVLDGFCSATGTGRTAVIRELLKAWSDKKLHEATLILRVAGRNPTLSESGRSPTPV